MVRKDDLKDKLLNVIFNNKNNNVIENNNKCNLCNEYCDDKCKLVNNVS